MLKIFKKATSEVLELIAEEKKVRKTKEVFLLFSLSSQFDHLIVLGLAKLGVYCLVADPGTVTAADVQQVKPVGLILSGGPASVLSEPPSFDRKIFDLKIPVLGICLGFQLWADHVGAKVERADKQELGVHRLGISSWRDLFHDCGSELQVLESHGDRIVPHRKIKILGQTDNAPMAAGNHAHLWGVQFHPEVSDTEHGEQILSNFCFRICGAQDRYPAAAVGEQKVADLQQQIGGKKVLLALSGGSDSSTVAYLLKHALADRRGQLRAIYIKGIDRPDDAAHVLEYFGDQAWLELKIVDATERFLSVLEGKMGMHDKRVAVRTGYKDVLEGEIADFDPGYIAQGTLYTDISESGGGYSSSARKARIKLHHNVDLGFSVPELMPLADCVKDSGRNIGRVLGVPDELLTRHPFPGPGMVVRVEDEVTASKLATVRQADGIFMAELRKWGLYEKVWQAAAVMTRSVTTCTKGDDQASGHVIGLWAVWSVNGFTSQAAELPWDFLKTVDQRICNEIREVGATAYRLSGKPPATIEWG